MSQTSKTGLLASRKIPVLLEDRNKINAPQLCPATKPAPVVLRPFAGIYNPFPYGCSVLCNHPADLEARDVLRKAKDAWAIEGKLPEEIGILRACGTDGGGRPSFMNVAVPAEDWVPEELFRKYTETDSRPATPAPTLASVATKNSGRRCVTPDPSTKEKTLLVLDLRRSQSQETLSWRGMVAPAPLLPPPAPSSTRHSYRGPRQPRQPLKQSPLRGSPSPQRSRSRRSNKSHEGTPAPPAPEVPAPPLIITEDAADMDPPTPRRRGRGRRGRRGKKTRDGAESPEKEFKGLDEPGETQISSLGLERQASLNLSNVSATEEAEVGEGQGRERGRSLAGGRASGEDLSSQSFLHHALLQQLQRQLDWETVESEFDLKRHVALEEAMRAPRLRPGECAEMQQLARDLKLPPSRPDLWLSVPRAFSRRSARFGLPLDSRVLAELSPLQYARDYVFVSESRKMLYNNVFNRHREDSGMENELRSIRAKCKGVPRVHFKENGGHGNGFHTSSYGQSEPVYHEGDLYDLWSRVKHLPAALADVLGQPLTPEELLEISELLDIKWTESCEVVLDFRGFCGVGAVAERVLASRKKLLPMEMLDPRFEVERADFEGLLRRIKVVERKRGPGCVLPKLLRAIQLA